MAKRTSTPSAAASGTATSIPTKPNSQPNTDSAKISHTGCSPTDEPTSLGVRKLPSATCPATKMPAIRAMIIQSPQNWNRPSPMASAPPTSAPT